VSNVMRGFIADPLPRHRHDFISPVFR